MTAARGTVSWNRLALESADAVGDERVAGFYPSLYLNLGHSHETLGDVEQAARYYDLAAARLGELPEGAYTDVVRDGVARALERMRSAADGPWAPLRPRPGPEGRGLSRPGANPGGNPM